MPPAGQQQSRRTRKRSHWLRLGQLVVGLFGFALGIALYVRSGLGLGPWDAFHYGIHLRTGLTIGVASIVVGLVILVVSRTLGMIPGLGTLLNMVLVGVFVDLLLLVVPTAPHLAAALGYFGCGILLTGMSSGMYIGAGYGPGPRDGLMVALALRWRWSVRRIRTLIEASALTLGWLMGGPVGVGTLLFVLAIGPSVQWGLALFNALPHRDDDGSNAPLGRRIRRLERAA